MNLIEIYVVRAETFKAVLAPLRDVLAREAHFVRSVPHREADLRGEDHLVADVLYRPAGDLLGDALRVDVRGVYKVSAGIEEAIDDLPGALLVRLPPEGHAPEAQLGDHQPRVSQTSVLHTLPLYEPLTKGIL